jgi:hypothetical protein
MRPAIRAFVAGGLGFAVSLIAACGGGSQVLSADQAGTLSAQLNRLQNAVTNGDCSGVQTALSQLSAEISNVGNDTARANLTEGYTTLQQQATAECPVSTPHTTSTQTTTTHTTTTTTPTVTIHTVTTPTTPTATTPTTPGTTTNSGPGSGGAGFGPGSSGGAPGQNGQGNGNGH